MFRVAFEFRLSESILQLVFSLPMVNTRILIGHLINGVIYIIIHGLIVPYSYAKLSTDLLRLYVTSGHIYSGETLVSRIILENTAVTPT